MVGLPKLKAASEASVAENMLAREVVGEVDKGLDKEEEKMLMSTSNENGKSLFPVDL